MVPDLNDPRVPSTPQALPTPFSIVPLTQPSQLFITHGQSHVHKASSLNRNPVLSNSSSSSTLTLGCPEEAFSNSGWMPKFIENELIIFIPRLLT